METTQNTFNGNGSNLGPFSFTFKWLESTDIKVSVGGVLKTAGTHYNLQGLNYTTKTGGQVLFTAGNAPPVGTNNIRIYRDTDDEALSAVFSSGSAIRAKDLNDNFTQNLYVTQEVKNNSVNIDGSNPMVSDLNMGGHEILNIAPATVNNSLVTKGYVDGYINTYYLGGVNSNPSTRPGGSPLQNGDYYINLAEYQLRYYNGSEWKTVDYVTEQDRIAAEAAKVAAEAAKTASETAQASAESARDVAVLAKTDAEAAEIGAEAANTAAQIAKNDAISARDDALLNSGVYATVAAGLAATAVGGYFKTFSGKTNDFLELYRVDSGPVAVLVSTYPSRAFFSYLESEPGYEEFYLQAWVDLDSRLSMGIKPDGTVRIEKVDTPFVNVADGGSLSGDEGFSELYASACVDLDGRVAYAVKQDGSLEINGELNIKRDASYSDYSFVEIDALNRISRAVRVTGEQYFPKADIDQLNVQAFTVDGQPFTARSDNLAGGTLGLFESRSDGSYLQIYRHFGGEETQLTSGSNNYNISLTSEAPERILFYSDRDGSQSAYVMNADGSDVYYANALSNIAVWGDSMSADLFESAIRAGLATVGASEPSRDVWNLGIGGQSSLQVALRMGALPWTAEIVGGEIPASGQVQITNHRTPLLSAFNQQYGLPTGGDNVLDSGSWNGGSYKDTYVEINGVKGQIFRTDATPDPDTYVFQRTTSGDPVSITNPVSIKVVEQALPFIGYGTPVSATTIASYTSILWPFGPHTTNNIQIDGVNVADLATADLEMDVVAAMIEQLGSLNKKFLLLYDVTGHPAPSNSTNDMRNRFVGTAVRNAYAANYPDRYFDPYPFVINGGIGVPSLKDWFAANYPTEYATDWTAPLAANVYTEPRAAATVTLTGNGGSGVTQNHTSVVTTSSPDTSYPVEIRDQTRRGLKVGVVASGGVVTSLWVREGGIGYNVGDTFTIAAGTIGNTSNITGTVASTQSEVIGTVRNEAGSVNVAKSYSQWDVDNGWFPRAARRDVVHFNTIGAEYFCLLLAAKLKSLNW